MYNYNELQAVELSPTKKDYYQIWNELIDVAGKLSSRWDPSATNESDPGIVLLKVLTAIADKLNYNIDANTLEAFMPSAAQESSMRKLCEMLGYNMQYYKSATTTVRITYKGIFPESRQINIDKFTNIKDKNSTYNYVTKDKIILTPEVKSATVECIEGELVTCQTENGNIVTLTHLDDNNRFYLPEQQIASNDNCVFISRVDEPEAFWKSTDNLNTCLLGSQVYQFGYDSSRALPYVQFPDDIGTLIGAGLTIKFLRTRGASGNISTHFLQTMEKPLSWEAVTTEENSEIVAAEIVEGTTAIDTSWQDLEQYSITNLAPARNGRNPETIDEAYWNYQKTIGTFDTLVTCRDYMNKIYQLTLTDTDTTPLVSNVIVSDIRDDINRAYTVCTYTDQGIEYGRHAHKSEDNEDRIQYFDLVLYPFETIYGLNTEKEFIDSFKYSSKFLPEIKNALDANKTIAHNFINPDASDIVCVKVYFQLSARLATTTKVSDLEAMEIESAAHYALYKDYNLRHMSFGDELPYDEILKTLTLADPRIKNVILDDPKMLLKVCLKDGTEIPLLSDDNNYVYANQEEAKKALEKYKQLVLMNVMAGKVPLFNYRTDFATSYEDSVYPAGKAVLETTTSLRLESESKTNPETINLVSVNSNSTTKTPAFIKAESGTLFLRLGYNTANAPRLADAFSLVDNIKISVYTKGASKAAYTYTISPKYADANDTKPSKLITILTDYSTGSACDISTFRYFGCLNEPTIQDLTLDALTLCQIPFNLTQLGDSCPTFDKVAINAQYTDAYINKLADPTVAAALEALTINFDWQTALPEGNLYGSAFDEDGNEIPGFGIELGPNAQTTLIADPADKSVAISFNSFDSFTALGYWPGACLSCEPALRAEKEANTYALYADWETPTYLGRISIKEFNTPASSISFGFSNSGTTSVVEGKTLPFGLEFETDVLYESPVSLQVKQASGEYKQYTITELLTMQVTEQDALWGISITPIASCGAKLTEASSNWACTISNVGVLQFMNPEVSYIIAPQTAALKLIGKVENDQITVTTSFINSLATKGETTIIDADAFKLSAYGIQTLIVENTSEAEASLAVEKIKAFEDPVSYDTFFEPTTAAEFVTVDPGTGNLKKIQKADLNTKDATVESITPASVASRLEIKPELISEDSPLVLGEGEVLQFRSPNFKTVATYPAYVNYYAHLNTSRASNNISGKSAVPATMLKLHEFFGGGVEVEAEATPDNEKYYIYIPLKEDAGNLTPAGSQTTVNRTASGSWNRRISWEEKVNTLPEGILTAKFTTAKAFKDDATERYQREQYKSLLAKYKALFVRDTADNKYHLFELPVGEKDANGHYLGIPANITFYVVEITEANLLTFIEWLRGKTVNNKQLIYRDEEGAEIHREKCITSLYTQGRSNLSRKPGKLVDQARFKYTEQLSLGVTSDKVLTDYYVPQIYQSTTADHTADGLGRDATVLGLPADTEYLLKGDEYILLTYSSSEGREDGVSVVKNIALGAGMIVKVNFELLDSRDKAMVSKYPKVSNYGPWQLGDGRVIQPSEVPGMFTFGADEQLEVREPISFALDDQVSNLYWEVRQPDKRTVGTEEREYFPFDKNGSYILQSGEYLFYTNAAMESMAYYGAGTEIKRGDNTPELFVKKSDRKISTELANEVGLVAAMPWTPFDLSGNKKLTITEYKLINLAPGDSLKAITMADSVASGTPINEDFKPVSKATYVISGAEGDLPALVLDNISWEVRSKLELALSSDYPQKLNVHRTVNGLEIARDSIMIIADIARKNNTASDSESEPEPEITQEVIQVFTPQTKANEAILEPVPMLIYSNTPILGADGKYFFEKDKDGKLKNIPAFKVCAQSEIEATKMVLNEAAEEVAETTVVDFAFDDNAFAKCDLGSGAVKVNLVVPQDCFGLATFYVPEMVETTDTTVQRQVKLSCSDTTTPLSIFNLTTESRTEDVTEENVLANFAWWPGLEETVDGKKVYILRQGLNTVYIPNTCELIIDSNETVPMIYIGKARVVYKQNQLNPQLAFASQDLKVLANPDAADFDSRLKFKFYSDKDKGILDPNPLTVSTVEVYDYIRHLDPDNNFYYTHIPSNFSGLDLNDNDPTDTLAKPKNWFDSQNLVNKFVVSELDTDSFENVGVSKFSKLSRSVLW